MKVSISNHEPHTSISKAKSHHLREHVPQNAQADFSKQNIILHDEELLEAYKMAYGDAIEKYNQKQRTKHPERCMTVEQYLQKIIDEEKSGKFGSRHPFYGTVIQIGDKEEALNDPDKLREIYEGWYERNKSHIHVISAAIHMDETTPHIHILYLPKAQATRGLTIKNSISNALEQLLKERGIELPEKSRYINPYLYWQEAETRIIEKQCAEMGFIINKAQQITPNKERLQAIQAGTYDPKKYKSIKKYRAEKEKLEALQMVNKAKQLVKMTLQNHQHTKERERDERTL